MHGGIKGGRVLLPGGDIVEADIRVSDGCIAAVGCVLNGDRGLDARGLLVLPGAVDLHGDSFERVLMPRPDVLFPADVALAETDRQLVANGITTAFHGVTCSWEPGLRGVESARTILEALHATRDACAAEHRVHLRYETHNVDAAGQVQGWIEEDRVHFVGFNDHCTSLREQAQKGLDLRPYAERSRLSVPDYLDLLERTAARGAEAAPALERLAACAAARGLAMASHDDASEAERRRYHDLGCAISEFPQSIEAAQAARRLGGHVIMGAPNVLRGGSHRHGVRASELAQAGVCDILASDYYYPALLRAPFRLAAERGIALGQAWALVSRNPARAAGLDDRGEIRPGLRADLLLLDDRGGAGPRLVATLVAGKVQFSARSLSYA